MMLSIIQQAQQKYADHGYVTFGLDLRHHVVKEKNKKKVLPPFGFNKFTLDSYPKANGSHNALGMCAGKSNNIFVIDVDEPKHWLQLLETLKIDASATELMTIKQHSANGGFHLFFQYDEVALKDISGTSMSFGHGWALDVRTNGNFIIVNPSNYKNDIVDWFYSWEPQRSVFDMKPLPMPTYLIQALLDADKARASGGSVNKKEKTVEQDYSKLRNFEGPFFAVAYGGTKKGIFIEWTQFLMSVLHKKNAIFGLFKHLDDAIAFMNRKHRMPDPRHGIQTTYLVIDERRQKWSVMQIQPSFLLYHCSSSSPTLLDRFHLEKAALEHVIERTRAASIALQPHLASQKLSYIKNTIYVGVSFLQSTWKYNDAKTMIDIVKKVPGQDIWLDALESKK